MDGFLLVDKPAGMTSHDVVNEIRRRLGVRRVGHAGTLDPAATGLLILGVGPATKGLRAFQVLRKTYEAEVTLGAVSTTDDAEGVTVETPPDITQIPSRDDVDRALQIFTGKLLQVPPTFSALKVAGVPAYRRARQGMSVALRPRSVTVYAATLLAFAYPMLRVRWTVSAGTYARALARDLGTHFMTGAYLSVLRRTAVGPFSISEAQPLRAIHTTSLTPPETMAQRLHEATAEAATV